MSDLPRFPGSEDDTNTSSTPARNRWLRVLVIVAIVAVLVTVVILHLTGAVPRPHGP